MGDTPLTVDEWNTLDNVVTWYDRHDDGYRCPPTSLREKIGSHLHPGAAPPWVFNAFAAWWHWRESLELDVLHAGNLDPPAWLIESMRYAIGATRECPEVRHG